MASETDAMQCSREHAYVCHGPCNAVEDNNAERRREEKNVMTDVGLPISMPITRCFDQ